MALSGPGLAIIALTTRAVPSETPPLSGREVAVLRRSTDVAALADLPPADVAERASLPLREAERVRRLLDRSTAVALAVETFEQSGIWTTTVADDDYPATLLDVLGDAAPPVLHGAGPPPAEGPPLLGIVGSRNVTPEAAAVAVEAARTAVGRGLRVVSGAARGVDALAMDAARTAGGRTVGVLADSLVRVAKSADVRRAILDGTLTLLTPFAPGAGFSAGFAMARNKVIYALAARVLVVASDLDRGGTWAGATEAIDHGYSDVVVWAGEGAGEGNTALAERGARPIVSVAELFEGAPRTPGRATPGSDQLSFAV